MMNSTIKDKIIKVPLVDQFRDTEDENWAPKACGICAVKMLIAFKQPELIKVPVVDLINRCVELGGFMENVGWRHQGLVMLAGEYGVEMDFQKIFPKTGEEKNSRASFINSNLEDRKPVIVSIFRALNSENGGHLVVVNGLKQEGRKISGYYIQDPDPRFRGSNYFITKEEFLSGWRGGIIWLR